MQRFHFLITILAVLLTSAPAAMAQTYQYDNAGRLIAAINTDGSQFRYAYDANSNVTRIQHIPSTVVLPPDGVIDTPTDDVSIDAGQSVNFTGTGADPDGAVPLTYRWTFDGAAADSNDEDPGDVTFATAGSYTVEFFVTDATGLTDPTPDSVVVTVTAVTTPPPPPPPPPPPVDNNGGGGGAMSWLLLLALLARRLRSVAVIATTVFIAANVHAQSWEPMSSPTSETLNGVWVASADEAWAVGSNGTILRFDGTSWQPESGTGTGLSLNAVWGSAADDIYVVGDDGYVAHFDGTGWDIVDIGAGAMDLVDVWSAGPGESLYVIGVQGAWEFTGGNWTRRSFNLRFSATFTPPAILTGIGGTADNVMITARGGDGGFYRNFREIQTWDLNDIWAASPTEMFAVGPESQRLTGDAGNLADWQRTPIMQEARGVWGSSSSDVHAVGEQSVLGRIMQYDGNATNAWRTAIEIPGQVFNDVDGSDAANVFAVGSNGIIYHYAEPDPTPSAANFPFAGVLNGKVNARTGELTMVEQDLAVGQIFPIVFERYYASGLGDRRLGGRYLGRNWTHNYEWRLDKAYNGNPDALRITSPRGVEYVFLNDGNGWRLETPTWATASLTEVAGNYLFVDQASERIVALSIFDGKLQYVEDRNGNRHRATYIGGYLSSISDIYGNGVAFEYNAGNRLASVYTGGNGGPNNRGLEVQFTYTNGVLSSTTSPGTVLTEYDYVAGRIGDALMVARLLGGEIAERWDYDEQGRVQFNWPAGGDALEYVYNGNTVTVRFPDGTTTRNLVHNNDGTLQSEEDGLGGTSRFEYDAFGRRSAWIDAANRRTEWYYHLASGKVSRIVQPGNFEWLFTLAPGSSSAGFEFHDVVNLLYPDNSSVVFEVDNNGNVTAFEDQERYRWLYEYDARGALVAATNPLQGVTRYTRNASGFLEAVTDPAGNELGLSYDRSGRLFRLDYADGSNVVIQWGDRLKPESLEFEADSITQLQYDSANRLVTTTRSDGASASFDWFSWGKVASVTTADSSAATGNRVASFTYDALGHIASINSALNVGTGYTYNVNGQLSQFVDGDNLTWGVTYDTDGFPLAVRQPDGDVVAFDNSNDARGLLTSISEGSNTMGFTWDAMSRLANITDPLERVSNVQRDLRGLVTSTTLMPAGISTSYTRDELGNVTEIRDPIGGLWSRDYDESGRLTSTTDPLGQSSSFDYDSRNRVSRVDRADGSTASLEYDGTGGVSRAQYSDGTEIAIDRSPEGRVMAGDNLVLGYSTAGNLTSSNGLTVSFDQHDRLASVTVAPGRTLTYAYDNRDNLTSVTDWAGATTVITPDERNRVKSILLPNGVTTGFKWDRASRIEAIDFGSLGSITLNRSLFGRVDSATRDLPGPKNMTAVDRQFSFNLASEIELFGYDARGNLTQDASRSYQYDGANRLQSYDGDIGTVRLTYDALGRIVASDGPVANRQFVQNYAYGDARVGVEQDGSGQDLWYYVYTNDGDLLYRIDGDGQRQFYHFDENGNAVFMTNDAGAVIATYYYSPLGEVVDSSGIANNDRKARAQRGGRELDGTSILSLGTTFADPETGHGMTRFDAPMIEEKDPDDSLDFSSLRLRLPSESFTSIKPPAPALKKALRGAIAPEPSRARALAPGGSGPVRDWIHALMLGHTLRLFDSIMPPLPGKLIEAPRAMEPGKSREERDEDFDDDDDDDRRPPFTPTDIRPPGFPPDGKRPDTVDSILKEVGAALVRA